MLDNEFFPTPPRLISRMLAGIEWGEVSTVLEPSAGKGDIAARIAKLASCSRSKSHRWRNDDEESCKAIIDCIEIDPDLRNTLKGAGFRVVHDDFLTYVTRKHYDLIVMNPPFSDGDRHLLKALELAQYGGRVVCLLNAETIRNPYSYQRKELAAKLAELGATVTFHAGEFSKAERPTDVEVALVSVAIPNSVPDSIILEDLREAQKAETFRQRGATEIVSGDFVEAIVARYRFETNAGIRLIHEYERIRPHMLDALRPDNCNTGENGTNYRKPILALTIDDRKVGGDNIINGYVRLTRLKYWEALFQAPQFTGQLTSNLQRELSAKVEALGDYEFSRVNILSIQRDLSKQTIASIEETIIKQFDDLSRKHSWDEDSANVHYYNGWRTNKSWKINERVVLPYRNAWSTIWNRWEYFDRASELLDLEKCLTFLNAGGPPEVSIAKALHRAQGVQQSRDIESSFFSCTFYKKGTCHIRFTRPDLLDRFNRFGAQRKGWLPPSYGRRRYADMGTEERAVVDAFEGQASYAKVMADPDKYIIEPAAMLRLEGAA
jgi:protein-L-isoaspartate O-methyltransferase